MRPPRRAPIRSAIRASLRHRPPGGSSKTAIAARPAHGLAVSSWPDQGKFGELPGSADEPARTLPDRLDAPAPAHYTSAVFNAQPLATACIGRQRPRQTLRADAPISEVSSMSRRCELTGKGAQVGHKVSHSNLKTKRRFLPNLLNVTMISDALGRSVQAARLGECAQDRRSSRRPRRLPAEGQGRRAVAQGARPQAPDREEAGRGQRRPAVPLADVMHAPGPACVSGYSDQRELQQQRALERARNCRRRSASARSRRRRRGARSSPSMLSICVAQVGLEQHRPVDQRARLDLGQRHAPDAHRQARWSSRTGAPAAADRRPAAARRR